MVAIMIPHIRFSDRPLTACHAGSIKRRWMCSSRLRPARSARRSRNCSPCLEPIRKTVTSSPVAWSPCVLPGYWDRLLARSRLRSSRRQQYSNGAVWYQSVPGDGRPDACDNRALEWPCPAPACPKSVRATTEDLGAMLADRPAHCDDRISDRHTTATGTGYAVPCAPQHGRHGGAHDVGWAAWQLTLAPYPPCCTRRSMLAEC